MPEEICPDWCKYSCIGAYRGGGCLIRTPEENQRLKSEHIQKQIDAIRKNQEAHGIRS